ncbi:MAG: FHA domain-containing protein [Deltaproteobacteria bacterium]|nr:FHA domain-containing protein [Deltaproteobacteria bacterium]
MKCEIRNCSSSETYSIPPEGFVFGRTGGPANVPIADQSVSKRHARVFMKDGQWFLEDLKSVNGTVVNNRRITEPVAITQGFTFSLSKHQFEVTSVDGASTPRQRESDPRRARSSQAPQPQKRQPTPDPADVEPLLPAEQSRSRSVQASQPVAGTSRQLPQEDPVAEDPYLQEAMGGGGGGASAVMAAIPKAIGYYLANVPLMLVNPIGTINKGVEDQKVKAMRPIELIAFAIPAYLAAMVAGNVASFIASAVMGTIAIGGFLVGTAISAAIAVVAGVVFGLIMHPVTKFVVEKIGKGETDEKSRSNYAVMSLVALILFQGAGALTALFAGVVGRLVMSVGRGFLILNVLPAALMAVAGLVFVYLMLAWAKYWRCANWVIIVCKILFVLSILGGVAQVGGAVWTMIQSFRGGASTVVVDIPTDPTKGDKGDDKGDKGDDKGDKGDDKGDKPDHPKGDDKGDKPDHPKGDDKGDKGDKPDHPKGDDKGDKPDHPKGDDKGDKGDKPDHPKGDDKGGDRVEKGDEPPKGDDGKASAIVSDASSGDYGSYKRKRTEIERRLTENPLLVKNREKSELSVIGIAYMKLLEAEKSARSEARDDLAEKKRGKPDRSSLPDAAVVEKYTEGVLFLKTRKDVDALYNKLPKE